MEGDPIFSLVRRTPGGVERTRPGVKRIVEGMVGDALELARETPAPLAERRFRIGDYDWCEPDYRQILRWATALELPPEEVLVRLFFDESVRESEYVAGLFAKCRQSDFVDGKLKKIRWSFDRLPLTDFQWEPGLQITHAAFYNSQPQIQRLSLVLPTLTHLFCHHLCLPELDLTQVPLLTTLECCGDDRGGNKGNKLTELNLTPVPRLTTLKCSWNELTELDLTPVPLLTELECSPNELTELDLTPVPLLTRLVCFSNQLTNLDLTPVPLLTFLFCGLNPLTELDLTPVPLLTRLDCGWSPLTELDLTPVPLLTDLCCWRSQLTELDLSSVPLLEYLECSWNHLTELDLASVPLLETLGCSHNSIGALDVRHLRHLADLEYDRNTTVFLQRPDQHF